MTTAAGRLLWADDPTGLAVHVTDAPRGKWGLLCPGCGGPVISKQGEVMSWHFAHANENDDRSCSPTAPETGLHKAAKQTLKRLAAINMGASLVGPAAVVPYSLLGIEVPVGRYVVDAMIRNGSGDIAIEFVVTHPCGKEKIDGLRALKQATLEIFVADRMFADAHDLAVAISGGARRKWLVFATGEGRKHVAPP